MPKSDRRVLYGIVLLGLIVASCVVVLVLPRQRIPVFMFAEDTANGTGGTATLIGETWGEGTVRFSDGTPTAIYMPKTLISMALLSWASYQKVPRSLDFQVKSVVLPSVSDVPLPYYVDHLGVKRYADDKILKVQTSLTIEVNGIARFQSPTSGEEVYWAGENALFWLRNAFGTFQTFRAGEMSIPMSVTGWDVSQYLSATDETRVVIRCTQEWRMYGYWVLHGAAAYGAVMGKPKSGQMPWTELHWIDPNLPIWGTVVNPEPVTMTFPKRADLPQSGFRIGVTPLSITMGTVAPANERSFQITVQTYGQYSGTVQLSTKNLPSGLTATIQPASVSFTPDVTLRGSTLILRSSLSSDGTYGFVVIGFDGVKISEVSVTIAIRKNETRPDERYGLIATSIELSLSSSTVKPKGELTVNGRLTDYAGRILANQPIALTSDFGWKASVTTDSLGKFQASVDTPEKLGLYKITAKFTGSGNYATEEQQVTFEVKRPEELDPLQLFWAWLKSLLKQYPWLYWVLIIFGVLIGLIVLLLIVKALRWAAASPSKKQ